MRKKDIGDILKKAQAAMEYLMTYGWAILIVIVVVAALYAMGVFTVTPAVPCSPCFSYFAFVDYGGGTAIIRNGARSIDTVSVAAVPDDLLDIDITPLAATSGDDLTITGIDTTGSIDLTVTYTVTASGLIHTDTARIHNA